MSLFSELRRRNVIRMAGLYLVGAWLIVQIAETLLPIFHTPDWVLQVLVVLLALGFVPALVFSWIYELTPDGLKRDADRANLIAWMNTQGSNLPLPAVEAKPAEEAAAAPAEGGEEAAAAEAAEAAPAEAAAAH